MTQIPGVILLQDFNVLRMPLAYPKYVCTQGKPMNQYSGKMTTDNSHCLKYISFTTIVIYYYALIAK